MDETLPWSCRGCPRKWRGKSEAHCGACHRHFSSAGNFDLHLKGGVCRTPRGMKQVDRAGGKVWVQAGEWEPRAIHGAPACAGCGAEFERRRGRYPRFCEECEAA